MSDKTVKYSILNEKGDEVLEATPSKALSDIVDKVKNDSRWLYIDKDIVEDIDALTEDVLMEAQDILLAHEHQGG